MAEVDATGTDVAETAGEEALDPPAAVLTVATPLNGMVVWVMLTAPAIKVGPGILYVLSGV